MDAIYRRTSIPGMMLIVLMGAAVVGTGFLPRGVLAQESTQDAGRQDVLTHTVRQGDTLYSISRRYDVSIEQIRRLNDLEGNAISIGQVLRLTEAGRAGAETDAAGAAIDSLGAVTDPAADFPEVAADTMRASADSMVAGTDTMRASADSTAPGSVVSAGGNIGRVMIPSGTSLMDVAVRFAIHPDSLLALNPGLRDPLTANTGVHVPVDRLVRMVTVRPGDTLFSIGRANDTSVEQLRELNDLSSDNLAVGQQLRIPVDRVEMDDMRPAAPIRDIIPAAAYPASYSGRRLLDGRAYDPEDFVVSHPEIPIGTTVLVTVPESGMSAFAVVADRAMGGATDLMDISAAIAAELNMSRSGTRLVEVRIVD